MRMRYNAWEDYNADNIDNDRPALEPLKPCPFCGGGAWLLDNSSMEPVIDPETGAYIDMDIEDASTIWCECQSCGVTNGFVETPEEAIAIWNRRWTPHREEK